MLCRGVAFSCCMGVANVSSQRNHYSNSQWCRLRTGSVLPIAVEAICKWERKGICMLTVADFNALSEKISQETQL